MHKPTFSFLIPTFLIRYFQEQARVWLPLLGMGLLAACGMRTPMPVTDTPVLPTAAPALGVGSTMAADKDGMTMVYVPAGEFQMGCSAQDADCQDAEKPQHAVYLDAFWIDRTEATRSMYARCVKAGVCKDREQPDWSRDMNDNPVVNVNWDDTPTVNVTWEDAGLYCAWAGRRLPTEAEWEKAARGTDGRIYPWGSEAAACERVNYRDCGQGGAAAVGAHPQGASPYGAYDMAGNVWELVQDWYDEKYYAAGQESRSTALRNPAGPAAGQYRAMRGGAWGEAGNELRSSLRSWVDPALGVEFVGFRCARSP